MSFRLTIREFCFHLSNSSHVKMQNCRPSKQISATFTKPSWRKNTRNSAKTRKKTSSSGAWVKSTRKCKCNDTRPCTISWQESRATKCSLMMNSGINGYKCSISTLTASSRRSYFLSTLRIRRKKLWNLTCYVTSVLFRTFITSSSKNSRAKLWHS